MTVLVKLDSDPNNYPSVALLKRFAFYADGKSNPVFRDANNKYIWNHITPTEIPTETHLADGTQTAAAGGFIYKISEYNANTSDGIDTSSEDDDMFSGQETNLSSPSVITGNFVNKDVIITVGATALNADTTHKKIYATKDGGTIFYYIGFVVLGTTTFTDTGIERAVANAAGKLTILSDGTVKQDELNYPIRNQAYITATKTRIFTAGSKIYNTGTVTVINGNATVTGDSTVFSRIMEGSYFQKEGDTRKYKIKTYVSGTEITLSETYKGTGTAGSSYEISDFDFMVRWTALHPLTKRIMWWAFPQDHNYRLVNKDYSPIMGVSKQGNKPVVYKRYSYTLFTESGDEFIPLDSLSSVGTCSHQSIVETSSGTNIFMTFEGLIYEASGQTAYNLNIDLSKTVDGLNEARLPYVQAAYLNKKNWYILLYSSEGSTQHNRMLIADRNINQYSLLSIPANCIGIVRSLSDDGNVVNTPWYGSRGKFVYKMLTGNNFGGGSESDGTLKGTITEAGATSLTDSGATFYTTDDGLADVYVSIYDLNDDFVEEKLISSNTADTLTVEAWDTIPTVGYTYEIGSIKYQRESKVFDFGVDNQKSIGEVLLGFYKTTRASKINISFYFAQDADMKNDVSYCKISFYTNNDYYFPEGLFSNYFRYCKYIIDGHGVADPITITSIMMDVEQHLS
jgi:hypothetical protein